VKVEAQVSEEEGRGTARVKRRGKKRLKMKSNNGK